MLYGEPRYTRDPPLPRPREPDMRARAADVPGGQSPGSSRGSEPLFFGAICAPLAAGAARLEPAADARRGPRQSTRKYQSARSSLPLPVYSTRTHPALRCALSVGFTGVWSLLVVLGFFFLSLPWGDQKVAGMSKRTAKSETGASQQKVSFRPVVSLSLAAAGAGCPRCFGGLAEPRGNFTNAHDRARWIILSRNAAIWFFIASGAEPGYCSEEVCVFGLGTEAARWAQVLVCFTMLFRPYDVDPIVLWFLANNFYCQLGMRVGLRIFVRNVIRDFELSIRFLLRNIAVLWSVAFQVYSVRNLLPTIDWTIC